MNIACCQFDIVWENKKANYAKVRALLDAAAIPQGSLVLLPEMFATGFSMNVAAIGEDRVGETEHFLANAARHHGIFLLGGVVAKAPDGRGRNEAVVFSPEGREVARYAKMQPFTPGGESQNYAAGAGPVIFPWLDFSVAPFICYDLRFPEIFRVIARREPHLFTVIASWPDARLSHWVKLLQARAIENQAYVAGVNRCGKDPTLSYSGRSLIVSPLGEILADAGEREGVINAEVDLQTVLNYRRKIPFLADMRADYVRP